MHKRTVLLAALAFSTILPATTNSAQIAFVSPTVTPIEVFHPYDVITIGASSLGATPGTNYRLTWYLMGPVADMHSVTGQGPLTSYITHWPSVSGPMPEGRYWVYHVLEEQDGQGWTVVDQELAEFFVEGGPEYEQ